MTVPKAGPMRVGVIGTGFVARHFVLELLRRPEWQLGRVLIRGRFAEASSCAASASASRTAPSICPSASPTNFGSGDAWRRDKSSASTMCNAPRPRRSASGATRASTFATGRAREPMGA